ncbi:MAG: hypothetical protein K2Y39_16540 [Candidatus Obscuribacterales bacterium]|nr:hypothetical protein [Candidatus Obscuribacterales bacterium]
MMNHTIRAFIVAICVVLSNLLIPAVCLAAPYEGTDPYTGLNEQQRVWAKDSHINELLVKIEALMADKNPADNATICQILGNMFDYVIAKVNEPQTTAPAAQAAGQAQANAVGNAAGDVARDQAIAAIDYASRFLKNFTSEKGNKWNSLRDNIFVPIALLLILPGAVLTQVKCIIAAGSPVVQQSSPFEGIQRAIIAVFLIPGTYLIVNYGIDFANSIQYTIATEYARLFGTDMYKDAICAEIRAFGVRYISENDGSLNTPPPDQTASSNGNFSQAEAKLWGKLVDPCVELKKVPPNRDDASMPASAIAGRLMMNASNASINTAWSILCAFQMAFFYYLYFVGPIMAALWVWPMKQLRDAFPSWVEGVVTLCFWSLFWHTTILLMACFKGTDETGLFVMSALNFLATACVKNAFDFAGLVRSAGQKASELIEKGGKNSGGGGGGSGAGSTGSSQPEVAQGNGTAQTVTQTQVSAHEGHGSVNKYQDSNKDGVVDGIWDSSTGTYVAPPPGSPLYLTNQAMPPADAANMEDFAPPPLASKYVITATGEVGLEYANPQTGEMEYYIPKVRNEETGEMVAQFIANQNGDVFEFNGRQYVEPQIKDPEVDTYMDKYRFQDGALQKWTLDGWRPVVAEQPQVAPPPAANTESTVFRDSVTANMADTYFPIMHYPQSAKWQDVDESTQEEDPGVDFGNAKSQAWEILEFAVQQLQSRDTQFYDNSTTQSSTASIPKMENDCVMSKIEKRDDVYGFPFNDDNRLAVTPPPLTFGPPESSDQQTTANNSVVEENKRAMPKVNLEAEIGKLFQRMTETSDASTDGLFIAGPKEQQENAYCSFAPLTSEELLESRANGEQKSALSRALGRGFKSPTNETSAQNDSIW